MGRHNQVPKEADVIRQQARAEGRAPPNAQEALAKSKSKTVKTVSVGKKPSTKITVSKKGVVKKTKIDSIRRSVGRLAHASEWRAVTSIGFRPAPTKRLMKEIAKNLREEFIKKGLMLASFNVKKGDDIVTKETKIQISADAVQVMTMGLSDLMTKLLESAAVHATTSQRMTINPQMLAFAIMRSDYLSSLFTPEELERAVFALNGNIPLESRFVRSKITTEKLKKQVQKARETEKKKLNKKARVSAAKEDANVAYETESDQFDGEE